MPGRSQNKDGGSVLWKHTASVHGGVMGPSRGSQDFVMAPLETWMKPLERLTGEALLIEELEEFEDKGKTICLNSKQDWQQSHTVRMTFDTGSRNYF